MEYYLCILDFEATCWEGSVNADEMEIIEFPSVLKSNLLIIIDDYFRIE